MGPGRELATSGEAFQVGQNLQQRFLDKVLSQRVEFWRRRVDATKQAAAKTRYQELTQIREGIIIPGSLRSQIGQPLFIRSFHK
jgi:hypothetical protein